MGADARVFRRKFALTALSEKISEQRRRFVCGNAGVNFGPVVQGRLFKQSRTMRHSAALGIVSAIIEPGYARMGDCACTHRTGLQRHPQVASNEPLIAEMRGRLPNGDYFGMGGRVMVTDRAVGTPTDNDTVLDDDGTNGHFALRGGSAGKNKRFIHHFAGFGQWHVILLAEITAFDHTSA